jgi:hypothetical protein
MNFRAFAVSLYAALFLLQPASAQTLPDSIAGVAFLIGDWTGGGASQGGMTDAGTSSIHLIVGGNAIERRDHNDVTDKDGKLQQSFDQVMLIYPEDGTLRADYLDGAHTIHYVKATVEPGVSVRFESRETPGMPVYTLTYRRNSPDTLSVTFMSQMPGSQSVLLIAAGTMTRK